MSRWTRAAPAGPVEAFPRAEYGQGPRDSTAGVRPEPLTELADAMDKSVR